MDENWIMLNTKIIDRNDLSIFEKMCCVVLSRYAEEDNIILTSDFVSKKMGCSIKDGKIALGGLVQKGIIEFEFEAERLEKISGNVLKSNDDKISHLSEGFTFEALEEMPEDVGEIRGPVVPDKSTTIGKLVKRAYAKPEKKIEVLESKEHHQPTEKITNLEMVHRIIDEKISEREAKIILSFAENNISKVKEKYLIAKKSQYNDKIEILINELQKPDNPTPKGRIIRANNNQIDHDKIERLRNQRKE